MEFVGYSYFEQQMGFSYHAAFGCLYRRNIKPDSIDGRTHLFLKSRIDKLIDELKPRYAKQSKNEWGRADIKAHFKATEYQINLCVRSKWFPKSVRSMLNVDGSPATELWNKADILKLDLEKMNKKKASKILTQLAVKIPDNHMRDFIRGDYAPKPCAR